MVRVDFKGLLYLAISAIFVFILGFYLIMIIFGKIPFDDNIIFRIFYKYVVPILIILSGLIFFGLFLYRLIFSSNNAVSRNIERRVIEPLGRKFDEARERFPRITPYRGISRPLQMSSVNPVRSESVDNTPRTYELI